MNNLVLQKDFVIAKGTVFLFTETGYEASFGEQIHEDYDDVVKIGLEEMKALQEINPNLFKEQ